VRIDLRANGPTPLLSAVCRSCPDAALPALERLATEHSSVEALFDLALEANAVDAAGSSNRGASAPITKANGGRHEP